MKSLFLLFLVTLSLPLAGAGDPVPATPPVDTSKGWHEAINTKVVQVFSAKDGDAIFRAYVVEYKGQQVIASDPLAKTNYKVGDTVRVLVMSHPYPQNREPYGLLAFSVTP